MSLDIAVGKFHSCLEERVLKVVSEYLKHAPRRVKQKVMSEEQNVEPPNEAVSFPVETQNYAPLLKKRKDSDNYVPKRKRDLGDVSDEKY